MSNELDAAMLSAFIFEIKESDLLAGCSENYDLATSRQVIEEISVNEKFPRMGSIKKQIRVFELDKDSSKLLEHLELRFPELHREELSSFIIATLE